MTNSLVFIWICLPLLSFIVTAQTIWEVGSRMKNPVEFTEELEKTELAMFGFSDEFIYELWGDIGDAKSGRLAQVAHFDEKF